MDGKTLIEFKQGQKKVEQAGLYKWRNRNRIERSKTKNSMVTYEKVWKKLRNKA